MRARPEHDVKLLKPLLLLSKSIKGSYGLRGSHLLVVQAGNLSMGLKAKSC